MKRDMPTIDQYVYCTYEIHFLCGKNRYLFGPPVFSRAVGCVARKEGRVYATAQCEPRPMSVAGALGLQTRGLWQVTRGETSRPATAKQVHETQTQTKEQEQVLACCCPLCVTGRTSPGHLAPRAWPPDHLASRPSSRATAATSSCRGAFVLLCVCTNMYSMMTNKGNISQTAVQLVLL